MLPVLLPAPLPASGPLTPGAAARAQTTPVEVQVRSLLLFAPALDDPRLREQIRLLKPEAAGLSERQVFVSVGVRSATAVEMTELDRSVRTTLPPEVEEALRRRFHVGPADFVAVLVGKDGGEKRRWTTPVRFEDLRDTIDAMPMRQDEMRERRPAVRPQTK